MWKSCTFIIWDGTPYPSACIGVLELIGLLTKLSFLELYVDCVCASAAM